jgi:SAM-dependent methyltransferase
MNRRRTRDRLPVASSLRASDDDQYRVLEEWLKEVVSPSDSLLDIGAGDGDDDYTALLRPLVGSLTGVEPTVAAAPGPAWDDWFQGSLEDYVASGRGAGQHDLAVAVYVVEHVTDPLAFFAAAFGCLRPGGSLFVITPNLWHYFGLVAKAAHALRLEDQLLGFARRQHAAHPGHPHAEHAGHSGHEQNGAPAHFALSYKANSVGALATVGAAAGFSELWIRHLENPAIFESYFPPRLASVPRLYSSAVHKLARGELYGTLVCRFVR